MSSGKKKTTTTNISNNDAPAWAVPYYQQALQSASNVASRPYVGYGGPTVAGFSGDQQAAFDMTRNQAYQNSALQGMAGQYLGDVISGGQSNPYIGQTNQYAGENPYLDDMIGMSSRSITENYNNSTLPSQLAQFNAGGAFGGSAMQQALQSGQQTLANQLGDTNLQFRNADYDRQANLAESALNRNASLWGQDQNARMGAVSGLGSLQQLGYNDANQMLRQGSLQQALQQQAINDDRAQFNEWRDWDANQLGLLNNALGTVRGGSSTSSSTGANPNYKSAGENAAGYAAILASLWGS